MEVTHVLLSLIHYLPIRGVQALSIVNIDTYNSEERKGLMKKKYDKYTDFTCDDIHSELLSAIYDDDVDMVQSILMYRTYRPCDTIASPILALAAYYQSERVFTSMCPTMVADIDPMLGDCEEAIEDYMDGIGSLVLYSSNPNIYEAFFSALSQTKVGLLEAFCEVVGDPSDMIPGIEYYAINDEAIGVIRKYFGSEGGTRDLLKGFQVTQSIEILKKVVDSRLYDIDQVIELADYSYQVDYIHGHITYDQAMEEESERYKSLSLSWIRELYKAI